MARSVDIADTIASLLDAATFSVATTVERRYYTGIESKDLPAGAVVYVSPVRREQDRVARSARQEDYDVAVVVVAKVVDDANATIDPLLGLVEDLEAYLYASSNLIPENLGKLVATRIDPLFGARELRELRVFVSLLVATFRTFVH